MSHEKVFNGDIVRLRVCSAGNTDETRVSGRIRFSRPPFNPEINSRQGRPEGSPVFACRVIKCGSSGLMTIKGNEWPFDLQCYQLSV